ncbi:MAG: carbohydrate binding family 9 domain-containing protein [Acidobacteriota bacterium]|nr:carbohydrate binding family 9 domain-containing protein [Acidobacteriota bacterium]
MKKFYAFWAVIFFAVGINAQTNQTAAPVSDQTPAANSPNTTRGAAKREATDAPPTEPSGKARFNLPPEKKNPVRVVKFSTPPVIDGKLDDEVWKTAQVLKDFIQTSPADNVPASKPTEVMLGYDEKNLYIAFKCWDEKDKIRATLAKRDDVFGEDNVRVWLDTYNDRRRAYVLGFNPLGIQQDGIFTEGQGADFSVDIVMESKGVIEDWGWSVEVKIPFKSLRYSAGKGKLWGFNAGRNIDRLNDEFNSWMPDDRNVSGVLIKHGKLAGLDEIKTERTLEIVPSVTIGETGRRFRSIPRYILNNPATNPGGSLLDRGRFVNQPINQDIGVNFKLNVTPNVTLDAAYNPDFAEIEADAPVVSANQRFPIFFQEKRPFFLEGSEIFQSPLQVFYSRTIIDPDIAAKLTGKIGKTSFGVLFASDNAPGNYEEDDRNDPSIRPRVDEFLDKNALFGVIRVKRDFGRENNVGFFGTYRGFPEQRNVLGGFDGRFKVSPQMTSQFQIVGTTSRRCFFNSEFEPSLEQFQARRNREICGGGSFGGVTVSGSPFNRYRTGNGLGYVWNLDYTEKNRGFYIEASGKTKDYRADAGFTRRTNTNRAVFAGRLSTEPNPKGKIIRFDWRPSISTNYDWQGRAQDFGVGSNFGFSFQRNTRASFGTGISYERVFEKEFGLKRSLTRANGAFFGDSERSAWQQYASANLNSSPTKKVSFGVFAGFTNNALDFDFGGGDRFPRVSGAFVNYQIDFAEYRQRLAVNPTDPTNIEPRFPGQDPGTGRQYDIGAEINLKPINPLRVSLEYSKSHLTRKDTGRAAFDSNIFTLRSTYQFTRFTFARVRWDYDSLNSNASGQMLLGWNPNPGTAVYVGYNDNFNYNGFNPYTGQLEPRFERNSRTFFIRASYLFRRSF